METPTPAPAPGAPETPDTAQRADAGPYRTVEEIRRGSTGGETPPIGYGLQWRLAALDAIDRLERERDDLLDLLFRVVEERVGVGTDRPVLLDRQHAAESEAIALFESLDWVVRNPRQSFSFNTAGMHDASLRTFTAVEQRDPLPHGIEKVVAVYDGAVGRVIDVVARLGELVDGDPGLHVCAADAFILLQRGTRDNVQTTWRLLEYTPGPRAGKGGPA